MRGYIVGFYDSWAYDRNCIIVGYYTNWERALKVLKAQLRINIDRYQGLRELYIVEIDVNKMYKIVDGEDWIKNYPKYYKIITRNHKKILVDKNSEEIEILDY